MNDTLFDLKLEAQRLVVAGPHDPAAILRLIPEEHVPTCNAPAFERLALALASESQQSGRPVALLLEFHSDLV